MADPKKWPLASRPASRGGPGSASYAKKFGGGGGGGDGADGGKNKGNRRVMISAEPKAPPDKKTRSPETIAKQKATREANAAAKQARADATGRPLERGNRVQRTQTVIGGSNAGQRDRRGVRRTQQIGRATGSNIARIRRGVGNNARVVGQSGTSSSRRTAPQTKKTQSSTEQRYRRMSSNLRKERREGRSGQFQAERLERFTSSRGRD